MSTRNDVIKVSGTTAAQRAAWRAAAGGGARDLSSWMRSAADRAAAHQAATRTGRADIDTLAAAVLDLRQVLGSGPGNALNQIARTLNADLKSGRLADGAPHERAIAAAANELVVIRGALNRILDRLEALRP